jgi:hypothetical protein
MEETSAHAFKLDSTPYLGPDLVQPFPDMSYVQAGVTFATRVGKASGIVRLVCTAKDEWKAYTFSTLLEGLNGVDEPIGKNRPHGGHSWQNESWAEKRQRTLESVDDVQVLVIGAGHC